METAYTFPNLTANGTLGGATAAVWADSENSSYPAYKAVNGNTGDFWAPNDVLANHTFIWYDPIPFKAVQYNMTNYGGSPAYAITAGTTYYSNDGTNWTVETASFTNSVVSSGGTWSIPVNEANRSYAKYRKLVITATSYQNPSIVEGKPIGYYIAQ